jgi:hypothetical protein
MSELKDWQAVKYVLDSRQIKAQGIESADSYYIEAIDGNFKVACILLKSNVSDELADFTTNYLPYWNPRLNPQDTDGAYRIDICLDSAVDASKTAETLSAAIPNGKKVTVSEFGGSCLGNDYIMLQWGSAGAFTTIRSSYGNFKFSWKKSFVGDGQKRFRILRVNTDTESARRIFAYLSAIYS